MTLQLKAGHYYEDRGGNVIGPMRAGERHEYPWTDGGYDWTSEGRWDCDGIASEWDLVKDLGPTDPRKWEPKGKK